MWKTIFNSHNQYLVGLLVSRNAKKTHTDQIILPVFFTLSEKKRLKNLRKWQLKNNFFPSVYVFGKACLDQCFLFHVITWRHFLYKFMVTQRFFVTVKFLRSLKQVFWKKSVFYVHYLQNNTKANIKGPK